MAQHDGGRHVVAVIVDVVDSRGHDDQSALLGAVADRVESVLVDTGMALSAAASVGDEFQAVHARAGDAVRDVARLRLSLLTDPPVAAPVAVRAGFGVGEVVDDERGGTSAAAPGQSGTAWWRARDALEVASRQRNGWPTTRWWAVGGGAPLTAALVALDTLLERFDAEDRFAALALLDGSSAVAIAAELGVVPSTLSARLHRHGVYGLVRTLEVVATDEQRTPGGTDAGARP